jgi:cytochrome P450
VGPIGPPPLADRAVQALRARAQAIVDAALRGKECGGELRVVEELLRFEPTAQYMHRNGGHDVEIGRVVIPAGTEVVCWTASANRDGRRRGSTAHELDITRENAHQHLAFGKGPHVCAGSWPARLEPDALATARGSMFLTWGMFGSRG